MRHTMTAKAFPPKKRPYMFATKLTENALHELALEELRGSVNRHQPNRSTDVALIREPGTNKVIGHPTNARNRYEDGLSEIFTQQSDSKRGSTIARRPTSSFRYHGA